jgi:hypothetical protein
MDLCSILCKLGLDVICFLLRNLELLYGFLLCLIKGLCGLLFLLLNMTKVSFGRIYYLTQLGRLISQLCSL